MPQILKRVKNPRLFSIYKKFPEILVGKKREHDSFSLGRLNGKFPGITERLKR